MWLTGFDAPCMHTMYLDKPMKGHGLMQAIARVNRVFRDKPAGLVVDYIGIAQRLKNALRQYSEPDQENTGVDEAQAVAVMMEKYEVVRAMFRPDTANGFDYRRATLREATPQERLGLMAGAIDWILTMQQEDAARPRTRLRREFIAATATRFWRSRRLTRWRRLATKPKTFVKRAVSSRPSAPQWSRARRMAAEARLTGSWRYNRL